MVYGSFRSRSVLCPSGAVFSGDAGRPTGAFDISLSRRADLTLSWIRSANLVHLTLKAQQRPSDQSSSYPSLSSSGSPPASTVSVFSPSPKLSQADHHPTQAVLIYWVTHNTFSILQALVLRLPAFKKWAKIPDPPVRDPKTASKSLGFWEAFQDTKNAFSDQIEESKQKAQANVDAKAAKKLEEERKADAAARRQAALDRLNASRAPLQLEGESAIDSVQPDGHVISTAPALAQQQAVHTETHEEAKKRRVAEARKRRENQKSRKSRF